MARVTAQDALEYCLANPDGLGVEELLKRFPEYREELQPLLALSTQIQEITPPPVPAERRAAMKSRLMEAATAGQQATQIVAVLPPREVVVHRERKLSWLWAFLRRPLVGAGAMAVLVVGLLWWGAATSLPDSPFYNIKLASENFMLNFAGGAEDKARAHLALTDSRLADIKKMETLGKLGAAGGAIANYEEHIKASVALWKQTDDGANDRIKEELSASVIADGKTFKGLEPRVPDPLKEDVEQLVINLSAIEQELANGGTSPTPTPAGGTPTASATPSKVAVPSAIRSSTPSVVVTSTVVFSSDRRTPTSAAKTPTPGQSPTVSGGIASATTVSGVSTPRPSATSLTVESTKVALATSTPLKVSPTATPTKSGVASRTAVPNSTRTPAPTRTGTPSKTPGVGATSTPFSTATSTYTATYTATSTASPRATATATGHGGPPPTMPAPPHTRTPGPPNPPPYTTRTPGPPNPPPHTRTPGPPDPPQGTPPPTTGPPPTRTAVPTDVPTRTDTPVPTATNTLVPPVATAEPTSVATCELSIEELDISSPCGIGGRIEWSATIENGASIAQHGDWVAVLEVKMVTGGSYVEVDRLTGNRMFQPHHITPIGGRFRYLQLPNTRAIRVELTLTNDELKCDEMKDTEKDCN